MRVGKVVACGIVAFSFTLLAGCPSQTERAPEMTPEQKAEYEAIGKQMMQQQQEAMKGYPGMEAAAEMKKEAEKEEPKKEAEKK